MCYRRPSAASMYMRKATTLCPCSTVMFFGARNAAKSVTTNSYSKPRHIYGNSYCNFNDYRMRNRPYCIPHEVWLQARLRTDQQNQRVHGRRTYAGILQICMALQKMRQDQDNEGLVADDACNRNADKRNGPYRHS